MGNVLLAFVLGLVIGGAGMYISTSWKKTKK